MAGSEIRDLLIKIKSTGGKETFKMLDEINKKVEQGINKNLKKTNNNLNTIGRTIKRRIADFEELKKAAKGTSGLATSTTTKALKNMNHSLKNIAESSNAAVQQNIQLAKIFNEMNNVLHGTEARADEAAEGIEEIGMEAKKATKFINGLSVSTQKFGNNAKHSNKKGRGQAKEFSAIAGAGGVLTSTYASLAANAFVLVSAFTALKDVANTLKLEENISAISSGHNLRAMAIELQDITDGALSIDAALRTAAEGTAFGFQANEMKELAKSARQASIALGRDFNDTLTRLTKGIAKQEVELLDELGIVTRLEPAMKKYAATHNTTVQALTDVERKTALYNEALVQLEENFGNISAKSTEFDKLAANLANVWQASAKAMIPYLNVSLKFWNEQISGSTKARKQIASFEGAVSASEGALAAVVNAQGKDSPFLQSKAYTESAQAIKTLGEELAKIQARRKGLSIVGDSEELKESAIQVAKITEQMRLLNIVTKGVGIDSVASLASLNKGLKDVTIQLSSYGSKASKGFRPLQEEFNQAEGIVNSFNKAMEQGLTTNEHFLATQAKYLRVIQDTMGVSVDSVDEYFLRIKVASNALKELGVTKAQIKKETLFSTEEEKISAEIFNNVVLIDTLLEAGQKSRAESLIMRNKELAVESQIAAILKRKADITRDIDHSLAMQLVVSNAAGALESELLTKQINAIDAKLTLQKDLLTATEATALANEKDLLAQRKKVAEAQEKTLIGGSAALTGLGGRPDIAQAEADRSLGNQEGVWANAAAGIQGVHSELATLDSAMGSITMGFLDMGKIMAQSMQNGAISAEATAAGIQAASQVMSGLSAQAVSEIDHQIAMERKRDGQSAKSAAKIRALEQKKLKEQQKAALQTAVMQTAAGITMALGSLPPPMSYVMAALTGVMGLAQISAIKSKGKNASALASSGKGPSKIEFGERMNTVDVSQRATAGERAFVTGQAGVGSTANNFVGAAAGIDAQAGTAINVGERGAEVFVPQVPGTIIPSGDETTSKSGGVTIAMNIDNIDAKSFMDRQEELMDAVDAAIRARFGTSLENL